MEIQRSLRKGLKLFHSVSVRGKSATWGHRPLTTVQMCQHSEPLHRYPNYAIVLSSLELSCMCVQSIKKPLKNKKPPVTIWWLGLHF